MGTSRCNYDEFFKLNSQSYQIATIMQFMHLKLVLIQELTIDSHELIRLTMIFDLGEGTTFSIYYMLYFLPYLH
jgi:hypothetical protein